MKNGEDVDVIVISDTGSNRSTVIGSLTNIRNEVIEQSTTYHSNREESLTSSSLSERCAPKWCGDIKMKSMFLNANKSSTPSLTAKVNNWLNRNTFDTLDIEQDTLVCNSYSKLSPVLSNRSSILVRQDYRKTHLDNSSDNHSSFVDLHQNYDKNSLSFVKELSTSTNYLLHKSNNQLTGVPVTIKNERMLKETGAPHTSLQKLTKKSDLVQIISCNSNDKDYLNKNDCTIEQMTADPLLNSDIQKKIELCNYLKLKNMTAVNSKTGGITKNRRSSRVKYLQLMSEKKELEKQLTTKDTEIKKAVGDSNSVEKNLYEIGRVSTLSSKRSEGSRSSISTLNQRHLMSRNVEMETFKINFDNVFSVHNNEKPEFPVSKLPFRSLQVPEVSTTSISQTSRLHKSYENNLKTTISSSFNTHKVTEIPSSEVVTRKSFMELCMNVNRLSSLTNITTDFLKLSSKKDNTKLSFFKRSAKNIPNILCDFDSLANSFLTQYDRKRAKLNNKNKNLKHDVPRIKNRVLNSTFKKLSHLKSTKYNANVKSNYVLNRLKTNAVGKYYKSPGKRNKLKSKANLTRYNLRSFLATPKKKNKTKKKSEPKLMVFNAKKEYKTTELIQYSQDDLPSKLINQNNKISMHLPDQDVWNSFTPEHKTAYLQSLKFLNEPKYSGVTKQVSLQTSNETSENYQTPTKIHVLHDETITEAVTLTQLNSKDEVQQSCEDLEVDMLMHCQTAKAFENIESTDIFVSDIIPGSSTDEPSNQSVSNSPLLETGSNDLIPAPSTSKEDTSEYSFYQTPRADFEVNNSERNTPSSCLTKNSYQNHREEAEIVDVSEIEPVKSEYVALPKSELKGKSLYHCLTQVKIRCKDNNRDCSPISKQNLEESFSSEKQHENYRKTLQYNIHISNKDGDIIKAYYIDYHLVVVQELAVSFWKQTPLGNILGAHNMWMSKGTTRRMVLSNGCVSKESREMVVSCNNSIAYIELWTKEHKSDKREMPVADVFIAIYMRLNSSDTDKKVLQLENIKSYASDVQYIVLRNSRCVIVSWTVNTGCTSSTVVHCYHLSVNFQIVSSITVMQAVNHYISSLHNIEDCDSLILGCGESKLTLWHLEGGYIVVTINLIDIHPVSHVLWAKCDRGFLFTVHQSRDGIFNLVAINSLGDTWKVLKTFKSSFNHDNLNGVCVEHGVLVAFYNSGILCWSAQTGRHLFEVPSDGSMFFPCGENVVIINKQVQVRHILEYLFAMDETNLSSV